MRRLRMLFLEFGELLLHVLVVRARCSLDFLGDLLTGLGGFLGATLDLLGAAFHLLDGL